MGGDHGSWPSRLQALPLGTTRSTSTAVWAAATSEDNLIHVFSETKENIHPLKTRFYREADK